MPCAIDFVPPRSKVLSLVLLCQSVVDRGQPQVGLEDFFCMRSFVRKEMAARSQLYLVWPRVLRAHSLLVNVKRKSGNLKHRTAEKPCHGQLQKSTKISKIKEADGGDTWLLIQFCGWQCAYLRLLSLKCLSQSKLVLQKEKPAVRACTTDVHRWKTMRRDREKTAVCNRPENNLSSQPSEGTSLLNCGQTSSFQNSETVNFCC